ncbi:hypothetical protein [Nonomuraea sp. KM90]|uniref:hypothetical protein n=1 Tax=Nonomuraea sp. KM90 TaxID=3457428 RepID=UPI003FCE774D
MNPWDEVLERIEAQDDERLAEFLNGLGDAERRMVARQVPDHLASRLDGAPMAGQGAARRAGDRLPARRSRLHGRGRAGGGLAEPA